MQVIRHVYFASQGELQNSKQKGAVCQSIYSCFHASDAGLQQIVTNFEKSKESLSGPVAIVAVGAEAARSDVANLFQFAAILNINLAVINILPLPVRHISLGSPNT